MRHSLDSENPQKQHYEEIHEAYEDAYYDAWSLRYRDRFIIKSLFEGLDLDGHRVAEIACGNGHNSLLVKKRFPGVETVGFDISEKACGAYEKLTGRRAVPFDLTQSYDGPEGGFDAALVVGGLHHMVRDLPAAVANLDRLLKPGGRLLLVEPNRHFLMQRVRDIWYRLDHYFEASSERALTIEEILDASAGRFVLETIRYFGGPAYFLVLNSLIFRLPERAKTRVAPALFKAEEIWQKISRPQFFPAFHAHLVKAQ